MKFLYQCWIGISILVILALMTVMPNNSTVHAQTHYASCENTGTTQTYGPGVPTSGTTAVQIVPAVAGVPIYVCSLVVVGVSGTTPTFSLVYGTGTNCATNQKTFLGPVTTTALTPVVIQGYFGAVPAGNSLCYLNGTTTPVQDFLLVAAQG